MALAVILAFGVNPVMAQDDTVKDEIEMQSGDIDQTRAELDRMQEEYEEKVNPGETKKDETPDVMLPAPSEWED